MKNKFNIGDRVVKADGTYKGKCGRVIGFDGEDVAVQFDEYIGTHDCGGSGKDGHCWWCIPENIKLLQPACVIFNEKETVLIKDGKKYVSKCMDGDTYDKEKGLLLCLAKANGISYKDLQEMIAGAKDCNAEKAGYIAGKLVNAIQAASKAFATAWNGDKKAQAREVKRKAEVGEYIKIVKATGAHDLYENGDIFKVYKVAGGFSGVYCDMPKKITSRCIKDNGNILIWDSEYVVLENYTPYKITLSEFWASKDKMAIHCDTEDKAKELLKAFDRIGKRWRGGEAYTDMTYHSVYGRKTIYDNTHGFADVGGEFHKCTNAKIFEFNEVDLEN